MNRPVVHFLQGLKHNDDCNNKYCIVLTIVTGNANYDLNQTTFNLLGLTQPQSAMPIIEDRQNNAKGFTSRVLWYFPKPIYCRLEELDLTPEEEIKVEKFQADLGKNSALAKFTQTNSAIW